MQVPDTERETLAALAHQVESDLSSAHAEICNLQGLDPATHSWPDWTPQANTLRWVKAIREKFGFTLRMDKITINGVEHEWPHDDQLSHEKICEMAGKPVHASVTYRGRRKGDSERSGITCSGESIKSDDGLVINCVVTGSA